MKNYLIILFFFFSFVSGSAFSEDWGQTGHRVTAEIATKHLSAKAKSKIRKILEGETLAAASTYADEIKSDARYRKYSPWHYVNIPFESRYSEVDTKEDGDIIQGIKASIAVLENKDATAESKAFHLKMLVHLIGDLHQPLHLGREEDKGGNDIQVRWFNEGTNLHAVWDTKMIEGYNMSYTELEKNLKPLSKKEIKGIKQGSLMDWVEETRVLTKEIYASAESGDKLSYRYSYEHFDTVKMQLQKGGIRLAKILNEIFG